MIWMFKIWDNSVSNEVSDFDDLVLKLYYGLPIPVITVGLLNCKPLTYNAVT